MAVLTRGGTQGREGKGKMVSHTTADGMDALVWTGPCRMSIETMPVPRPVAGEVLVEIVVAGICGSELSGYLGLNRLRVPPLVMGHEAAGRIVRASGETLADGSAAEIGRRVTFNPLISCGGCDRCAAGRPNLCRDRRLIGAHRPGAFAQYVAVPAELVWPLPPSVSDAAGALAEPVACAVRAVRLGGVAAGERVLVLGAGTIGLCILTAARRAGAGAVVIADVAASRRRIAERWGADAVLDPAAGDLADAVRGFFPGGAGIVVDAAGASGSRAQAVECVVPGGRIVLVGLHEEESPLAFNAVIRQEVVLMGSFAYTRDDFGEAVRLLAADAVTPEPWWIEERPLDRGADAFADLADGRAAAAKTLLRVTP